MTGSGLLVAVENATWVHDGQAVYLGAGTVVRASNPIVKGHEALFQELVVQVAYDDDLLLSKAQVAICGGEGDPALEFGTEAVRLSRWRTRPVAVM